MSELTKLRKIIQKLEKRHDRVGPVERKRIMKKAVRVERKIKYITSLPQQR